MIRDELGSLAAFVAVAEAGSFTRAAGRMGTSQSALSHRIRRLEERLGTSLLARNTRSVSVTEAGARLLETLGPALHDIESRLNSLKGAGTRVAGVLRITSADHAAETILWPALKEILPRYPDISVEVSVENRFVDIVSERFDAGIRLGSNLDDDMIAVPIGPRERGALVASPAYLARRGAPATPDDLSAHECINRRMASLDGIAKWTFAKDGRQRKVKVAGQLAFDRPEMIIEAALEGFGVAYLLDSQVRKFLASGQLVPLLPEWALEIPGYHLYYPSRKHKSPALAVLVEAMRYTGG